MSSYSKRDGSRKYDVDTEVNYTTVGNAACATDNRTGRETEACSNIILQTTSIENELTCIGKHSRILNYAAIQVNYPGIANVHTNDTLTRATLSNRTVINQNCLYTCVITDKVICIN